MSSTHVSRPDRPRAASSRARTSGSTARPHSPRTPGRISPPHTTAATLRLYVNGTQVASVARTGTLATLEQPAQHRRRHDLQPVLRRPHRRRPRLQHCAHRRSDPDRHGDSGRREPAAGHGSPDGADQPDGNRDLADADQPHLDGLDRHRRRHRVQGRALSGRRVHDLRRDRDAHRDDVQQHRPHRRHDVPLPGTRHRRSRESERVLEHRDAGDTGRRPIPRRRRSSRHRPTWRPGRSATRSPSRARLPTPRTATSRPPAFRGRSSSSTARPRRRATPTRRRTSAASRAARSSRRTTSTRRTSS